MKLITVAVSLLCSTGLASAAINLVSIGVNFTDDASGVFMAAGTVAGALTQANWNNATGPNGSLSNLTADFSGGANPSPVAISWSGSPNTWSSTGRGEENNGFAVGGGDRELMTGYIDTSDVSTTTVTVTGIPEPFASNGYDVLVYSLGGVAGRGGLYTIGSTTLSLTSPANPSAHFRDPGVDLTDTGTYGAFVFSGSSFTLTATAIGANFRAPINGIQIVERAVPEPTAITFAGLVTGLALWRRRR